MRHAQVHLESWPAGLNRLKFDDTIASPSNNGNGFAIVNNTIGNLRGRGMLVKSSNGVIAHNRLFNLKVLSTACSQPLFTPSTLKPQTWT